MAEGDADQNDEADESEDGAVKIYFVVSSVGPPAADPSPAARGAN